MYISTLQTKTSSCTCHTVVFTACVHGRPWPCTDLVHGHARTVYIAGQRPCTRFVHGEHGRERPCTFRKHAREHGTWPCRQALNTAVFTVRTRLCTRAVNTPVYRVRSRARPCSGHGRTMYTACAWPCTHAVKTAVYKVHGHVRPCTQPCSGHGRTIYTARASCTCTWAAPVHGP